MMKKVILSMLAQSGVKWTFIASFEANQDEVESEMDDNDWDNEKTEVTKNMTEMREVHVMTDGQHTGTIVGTEKTSTPYKYVRLLVAPDGFEGIKIRVDLPESLTYDDKGNPRSLYAKVIKKLGFKYKKGADFNEKELVGTKVTFETETDETERGTFNRIIAETLEFA